MSDNHQTEAARRVAAILEAFLPEGRIGSVVAGSTLPGAGATLELVNPADGRVCATYADAGAGVVDAAMEAARPAQRQWWSLTAAARGRAMWEIARLVRQHA